jgi:hypothetical protein
MNCHNYIHIDPYFLVLEYKKKVLPFTSEYNNAIVFICRNYLTNFEMALNSGAPDFDTGTP